MNNNLDDFQQINTIENLIFTNREIDVIACLLHGKSVKKIAYFFSISSRTVEVHIRNIMLKIGCGSRQKILDFVESSKNHQSIIDHYHLILEQQYGTALKNKILLVSSSGDNQNISDDEKTDQYNFLKILSTKMKIIVMLIMLSISVATIIYFSHNALQMSLINEKILIKSKPECLSCIIHDQLIRYIDDDNLPNIKVLVLQAEKILNNAACFLEKEQLKYQVSRAYRYLGEFQKAIAMLESIKDFYTNIDTLSELGTCYLKIGQYDKAILLIENALQRSKKIYGLDSIQTAKVEILLDAPYRKLHKYKETKELLEHSLKIHNNYRHHAVIGDIAWIYTKLGYLNIKLDNFNEAIKLFTKALEIQINLYGKDHIRTAWTYVRMAIAYKELNNYSASKNLLEHSLKVYGAKYGIHHIKYAWVLGYLAEVEGLLNNTDVAKKYIIKTLEIQTQHYGKHNIRLAWALNILSNLDKTEKHIHSTS